MSSGQQRVYELEERLDALKAQPDTSFYRTMRRVLETLMNERSQMVARGHEFDAIDELIKSTESLIKEMER